MFLCIKNYMGTQGEDLSTINVLYNPGSLCYRPFQGGGPGVILILCSFVVFATGRFMLSCLVLCSRVFRPCLALCSVAAIKGLPVHQP